MIQCQKLFKSSKSRNGIVIKINDLNFPKIMIDLIRDKRLISEPTKPCVCACHAKMKNR
jgi:hypothetical protein